ncbi:MAG TPA: NAD-binding protein, partial [Paracoccaceae bacterium]|nr:NAD-binding protein [Paracoccaceae bacterium]
GLTDGALLAPLAFVLVAVTVVLHGFSLAPVARLLGLTSKEPAGVILVGGSSWTSDLGEALQEAGVPVVITDRNWFRLREARERGLPVYFGEFLSEATEHRLEMNRYGMIWALSDNDDYNTLVCTNYAPEFGRNNVFQIGRNESSALARALPETIGGRRIGTGLSFEEFQRRSMKSWEFVATPLTEEFGPEDHFAEHPKAERIAVIRSNGAVVVFKADFEPKMQAGDSILAMAKIELPVEKNEEA